MSYLIHNFSYTHYAIRSSWKTRTVIAARNSLLVYLSLTTLSAPFNRSTATWQFSQFFLKTSSYYFSRLFYVLFPKVKEIKHTPIGLNFPCSAHYAGLRQLDLTLTPFSVTQPLLPLTLRRFLYPYPFGSPLLINYSSKNILFDLIYRFFSMSLNLWFYWPASYKTWVHHMYVSPRIRPIWFLNKYYFKVYHI